MVNTVFGPVNAEELGQTLIHEHITAADWSFRAAFGKKYFDRDKVFSDAVAQFGVLKREYGLRTVADGTPINLGRDVGLIKDVAEASGVNFIVSTGFYTQMDPVVECHTPDEKTALLVDECKNGILDTGIRPGIFKCAVGEAGFTDFAVELLGSVARAAKETGLPVFCHTTVHNRSGERVGDIFTDNGVDPEKLVIGHSGDSNDIGYLEGLLKRGFYLGMDRFGLHRVNNSIENRVETIAKLCEKGWADKLLLSHDRAVFLGFGGGWDDPDCPTAPDLTTVHRVALPMLRKRGVSESDIEKMLISNPARLFA